MQNRLRRLELAGADPCMAGVGEADPKAGGEAGVAGGDEESRSEGSGDLGRSSPELGDGRRARETEGSGVAARIPCR